MQVIYRGYGLIWGVNWGKRNDFCRTYRKTGQAGRGHYEYPFQNGRRTYGNPYGVCVRAGADIKTVRDILDCVTTDAALEVLKKNGLLEKTMEQLMLRIDACLQKRGGDNMQIGAVVFSNEYGLLGKQNRQTNCF